MQFGIHIYIYIFVKIYVGFVADIDIKIFGGAPPRPGMPLLDSDTCAKVGGGGGVFISARVFFPV
jgi:hypothetical protein